MTRGIVLFVVCALAVAACGGEAPGDRSATDSTPAATATAPAAGPEQSPEAEETAKPIRRPGCGELCQHAGPPAGTDAPGCPGDDSDNCLPCPELGCAEVLSDSATIGDGGLFTVQVRCKVDYDCEGALLVQIQRTLSGRVAASDVKVPAGEVAEVPVALTSFGRDVLGAEADFTGTLYLFLEGTGQDQLGRAYPSDHSVPVELHSQPGDLHSCGRGIRASQVTSCPFARNVESEFARDGVSDGVIKVSSPVTGRAYSINCYADEKTINCGGGHDAFVTFPDPP
jgi:hypothetical protein